MQVGKHGIIIEFSVGGSSYSATYLPEVAGDRGALCVCVCTACLAFRSTRWHVLIEGRSLVRCGTPQPCGLAVWWCDRPFSIAFALQALLLLFFGTSWCVHALWCQCVRVHACW